MDYTSPGEFGDRRLSLRFGRLLSQFSVQAESSVSSRLLNPHQLKAYYRFVNNEKVSPSELIDAYRASALAARDAYSGLILSIQDTTELNYTTNRSGKHLGPLAYKYRLGMFLHNHTLNRSNGSLFGLFSQRFHWRDMNQFGKGDARRNLPLEQKESYRWLAEYQALEAAFESTPERTVLCICDREADFHELLQARRVENVHYLIRSKSNRKLAQQSEHIYEEIGKEEAVFGYELDLPKRKKEAARKAQLSVRYTQVRIHAGYRPKGQQQLEPVTLNLIEVKEETPEAGIKPICWRLFTSMELQTHQQVAQMIQYYVLRWTIERFHYVLKQGFKIQDRQIENPQALQNAIVLDSWAALQICATHYLVQTDPQLPIAEMGLTTSDFYILKAFLAQRYQVKFDHSKNPTIKDLHLLWAIFGGYQNQKNKDPGMITLWRGWQKCNNILEVLAFKKDMGNQ